MVDAAVEDVVLADVHCKLPPPPAPPPPAEGEEPAAPTQYEALLAAGDLIFEAVPIALSQDGDGTCRPLKGVRSEELLVIIREVGSEAQKWSSEPLVSLGVGTGPVGKISDAPLSGAGGAHFSCVWRMQRTLSPSKQLRTRPLAMKYSAPEDRSEFEARLNLWRLELGENRDKPSEEWTQEWRPPYPAHHLSGDPLPRRLRAAYIENAASNKVLFRAQAISVHLEALRGRLPICQTAEQAVAALVAVREFLEKGDNLQQIDASTLLRQIRNLRLPFERLVRNVWQEGPEVAYDRTKAALQRLLQREVATRKAALAAAGPPPPPPPDTSYAGMSPAMASEISMISRHTTSRGQADSHHRDSQGLRLGLLTFQGSPPVEGIAHA